MPIPQLSQSLTTHLKAYRNIAWYPASHTDFSFAHILRSLELEKSVAANDLPDCLLMTDLWTEILDTFCNYKDADVIYQNDRNHIQVQIFNIRQIKSIHVPQPTENLFFYQPDHRYGQVYTADLLTTFGQHSSVIHLVFAFAENFGFLQKYILKHKIPITYLIHHNWGMGTFYDHLLPHLAPHISAKYYFGYSDSISTLTPENILPDFTWLLESPPPALTQLCAFSCTSEASTKLFKLT